MSAALRRLVVALAGGLLASGALVLAPAPAVSAPSPGPCIDDAGVTVVVDFGSLGGGVQVRCAPAPVANGFEALTRAGFAIAGVSGQPFLCRIDGLPADDPCHRTPSAARYWSYWHAERGEDWAYSSSGASRRPPGGSVEGWSFGDGDEPGAAPPGRITTPTTPPPAPPTTSPATPSGPLVTAAGPPTTIGSADPTEPSTTAATSTTTTAGPGADPGDGAGDDADELVAADRPPTGSPSEADAGSPAGLAAAVVLVSGLGIVGFGTARRRARHAEASA